jgi:phenylalanyl-tRNA synthetase beta chain
LIISENWLREWVDFDLDFATLADRLTAAGLEAGALALVPRVSETVIAGRITHLRPHPDATNLSLCEVDNGSGSVVQVVCGATNARAGMVTPLAMPGAILPDGSVIRPTTIRNKVSTGMLCSGAELGIDDSVSGLLELDPSLAPGTSLNAHLDLGDQLLEVDLTPNRGDCLSLLGIARETAVVANGRLKIPSHPRVRARSKLRREVELVCPAECPRYMGRIIEGLDTTSRSPDWIRERLRRCGIRSIDVLVDISNYVMLELGQPMHAFDAERLRGRITVRAPIKGERLKLLDGVAIRLSQEDLVIADDGGPIALAGVKGGMATMITHTTRVVMLEAAFFAPTAIARTVRSYNMPTDASHRFERGVDFELPSVAIQRASELIVDVCGGACGPIFGRTIKRRLPPRRPLTLRKSRLERLLGEKIPARQVRAVFNSLGMSPKAESGGWTVTPPSYRFDLSGEHDLVEEVARIVGYDKIKSRTPRVRVGRGLAPEGVLNADRARDLLVDREYFEAITYSFINPALQALVAPGIPAIDLRNPIASHLGQMRLSLLPGLLEALSNNARRQIRNVRFFETGHVYLKKGRGRTEIERIAGVSMGVAPDHSWDRPDRLIDFFDVKGDVEALLRLADPKRCTTFEQNSNSAFHPGQCAQIWVEGQSCGWIGRISPQLQEFVELESPIFAFELDWDLINKSNIPQFSPASRFPVIGRDLSFVFSNDITAAKIRACIRKSAGELLATLDLVDIYRGKGIKEGKKSATYRLTLQSNSRSLTDKEADNITGRIIAAIASDLGGELRTG